MHRLKQLKSHNSQESPRTSFNRCEKVQRNGDCDKQVVETKVSFDALELYNPHVFWQYQKLSCQLTFQLGSVLQNESASRAATDSQPIGRIHFVPSLQQTD